MLKKVVVEIADENDINRIDMRNCSKMDTFVLRNVVDLERQMRFLGVAKVGGEFSWRSHASKGLRRLQWRFWLRLKVFNNGCGVMLVRGVTA